MTRLFELPGSKIYAAVRSIVALLLGHLCLYISLNYYLSNNDISVDGEAILEYVEIYNPSRGRELHVKACTSNIAG